MHLRKTVFVILSGLSLISASAATARELTADSSMLNLVVTEVINTSQSTAVENKQRFCTPTPNGKGEWCVLTSAGSATAGVLDNTDEHIRSYSLKLPSHGNTAEEAAAWLTEQGIFGLVEADVLVRTPDITPRVLPKSAAESTSSSTYTTSDIPSDPELSRQEAYYSSPNNSATGKDILTFWQQIQSPGEPVTIAVLDSSFYLNKELEYSQGASTTRMPYGEYDEDGILLAQERTDDFFPRGPNAKFCTGHGVGVASVAAGLHNNDFLGAGVARNVTLHPVRVMDCGVGFLSDSSAAIDWLAGEHIDGLSDYTGDIGIINMSLSGQGNCPTYMQTAINKARAKGWTLVAAAGNQGDSASNRAPANCEGVVTVAALDRDGNLADFSNVGDAVNVTAQGDWVFVPCGLEHGDERMCFAAGTSFSAPLVAGALAEIRRATGVTGDELASVVRFAATDVQGQGCDEPDKCGSGLINIMEAYNIANRIKRDTLFSNAHDYDGDGQADIAIRQTSNHFWYIDNSSNSDIISNNADGITRINFSRKSDDIPVTADYDGDGIADLAAWRASNQTWYILNSSGIDLITGHSDGITRKQFGFEENALPVPADYDGDGITDLAVRRLSNQMWYILNSTGIDDLTGNADGITRRRFGLREDDIPVPADYDGDLKADIAVRRPSDQTWYILNSSGIDRMTGHDDGVTRRRFGLQESDIPVVADYDGDGIADLAVRRPTDYTWYILNSSGIDFLTNHEDGITRRRFGIMAEDIPVPADYDGDNKVDIAVRRPSNQTWYILNSSGSDRLTNNADGVTRLAFGQRDGVIPNAAPLAIKLEMLSKIQANLP